MAKNFIQPGRTVTLIAPADVKSGDLVVVGKLFGVAVTDASSGDPVEACTEGVYTLPKTAAQAWTLGAAIYWDGATKKCTTADGAGANVPVGHAVAAAANPSDTGTVRLSI